MNIPNYSSIDMAIHAPVDLKNALQTPRTESTFQGGDSQLKAIMEPANICYARTQIPNRDSLPDPPSSPLTKESYKLPRVEDQTASTRRVDSD